jgi:uncharacterized membrane protein
MKTFLLNSLILLFVDYFFLKMVSNYFDKQVTLIQGSKMKFRYTGAILAYIVLIISYNYFYQLTKDDPKQSYHLAVLGWSIYFVYEYTNYAIFKDWKFLTTIIDGFWGGFLFYLVWKIKKLLD